MMEVKMFRKSIFTLLVLIGTFLSASCSSKQVIPTPLANLANPASVNCEQNGGTLDLRQDASGGVAGVCVFPDGSECDEWAYLRGECKPASPAPTSAPESTPTEFPTPRAIDLADYQGWWTYTNSTYGFSIMLPFDWVVDETTTGDALMNGHMLMLQSPQGTGEGLQIRMTFRHVGEDVLLWPTGVGSGEFVPQGTLDVAGQPAQRVLFVCPTGQVNSIWYQDASESNANIQRGDMEFGFIVNLTGFYCEEGHSLSGKNQYVGEMVIASLQVP
jgi:putative hemolysin